MKIFWTTSAIKDLESIYNYISTDSELYATDFVEKIV